jgi:hypothetical protein
VERSWPSSPNILDINAGRMRSRSDEMPPSMIVIALAGSDGTIHSLAEFKGKKK